MVSSLECMHVARAQKFQTLAATEHQISIFADGNANHAKRSGAFDRDPDYDRCATQDGTAAAAVRQPEVFRLPEPALRAFVCISGAEDAT
jgi:hypothetical protein